MASKTFLPPDAFPRFNFVLYEPLYDSLETGDSGEIYNDHFDELYDHYNTAVVPLQSSKAFCADIREAVRKARSSEDSRSFHKTFHKTLSESTKKRRLELAEAMENIAWSMSAWTSAGRDSNLINSMRRLLNCRSIDAFVTFMSGLAEVMPDVADWELFSDWTMEEMKAADHDEGKAVGQQTSTAPPARAGFTDNVARPDANTNTSSPRMGGDPGDNETLNTEPSSASSPSIADRQMEIPTPNSSPEEPLTKPAKRPAKHPAKTPTMKTTTVTAITDPPRDPSPANKPSLSTGPSQGVSREVQVHFSEAQPERVPPPAGKIQSEAAKMREEEDESIARLNVLCNIDFDAEQTQRDGVWIHVPDARWREKLEGDTHVDDSGERPAKRLRRG